MDTLAGRTLSGRYELGDLIGRGGTADTYRAIDTRLGREIAVKVLIERSDDVNARLLLEARAMASLNHPRIVSIFDAGEADGLSYIVMELVKGKTLRDLEGGALTFRQAMGFLIDVLEALDYAHGQGVVHRDIKPSNIMTVEDNSYVKLMDFGLARRSTDVTQTTRSGQIVGTIAYLAPERFLSKPADVRSDLYSVGIVMYEIFTGTVPFRSERDDLVATMFSHVHDLPAPARQVNRAIPEPLERVIMRAIEREPAQRYQTARQFIVDMKTLVAPQQAAHVADTRTPRNVVHADATTDSSLRDALDRALASSRNRSEAIEAVLKGMMATRRRNYDEAREAYLIALHELSVLGNDVEYAKTTLKYASMILQKAADGIRERSELRDAVNRLTEALRIFHEHNLHESYGEAEYLANAIERSAIGL
ncbi:MAG: protein kinase domain-containing protein [Vulcanimicrobiaceae bacterium]